MNSRAGIAGNRLLAITLLLSACLHLGLLAYDRPPAPTADSRSGQRGLELVLVTRAQEAAAISRRETAERIEPQQPRPVSRPAAIAAAPHKAPAVVPANRAAPRNDAPATTTRPASSTAAGSPRLTTATALNNRLHHQVRHAMQPYFSYPLLARRRGWEGTVRIGLRINADGHISRLHIVEPSNYPALDRAALDSLGHVRHIPEAVAWLAGNHSDIVLPVEYRLTDG